MQDNNIQCNIIVMTESAAVRCLFNLAKEYPWLQHKANPLLYKYLLHIWQVGAHDCQVSFLHSLQLHIVPHDGDILELLFRK
jgi:hypothetical protein